MEWIQTLLDSSEIPLLTAFLLGLLTALSPCPLATNISACAYIGKEIGTRHRAFISGLLYGLGRVLAYTLLGALLIRLIRSGEDYFALQDAFSRQGERFLPALLLLIGLFMLFGHKLPLPRFGFSGAGAERLRGYSGSLLLGILFALSFCPVSAMLYFGMLIPMAAAESGGYALPAVFAAATALPVLLVAWLLAYGIGNIASCYKALQKVQRALKSAVAVLFILVALYEAYLLYA